MQKQQLQTAIVILLSACCGMMAGAFLISPIHHQTTALRTHHLQSLGEPTLYEYDAIYHDGDDICIENIDNLQLVAPCAVFEHTVVIRNCTITSLQLYSASFIKGFQILNCTIYCKVNWAAGGHNEKGPVVIQDCVFCEFVDVEDCWFFDVLRIERVKFLKGTNLLEGHVDNGGAYNPFRVSFEVDPVLIAIEGNLAGASNFTITGPSIRFIRSFP